MNKAVLVALAVLACCVVVQAQFCKVPAPAKACVNMASSDKSCAAANCPTWGTQCNSTTKVCELQPNLGQPCRPPGPGGNPIFCYSESLDLECKNAFPDPTLCTIRPDPLGVGQTGCQNEGCAGLLECMFNDKYPNASAPEAWVCTVGNASVGEVCEHQSDCKATLICERHTDPGRCYARYSKIPGDECTYTYNCKAGLMCKNGVCQNVISSQQSCNGSSSSCPEGESCTCPDDITQAQQNGTCITAWGPAYTQAYADAELAILDCLWANCPAVDNYDECKQCNKQLCTYYDQMALAGEVKQRWAPDFFCGPKINTFHDIDMTIDYNHIAEVCGLKPTPLTTTTNTNTGSDASAVAVSLLGLAAVALAL